LKPQSPEVCRNCVVFGFRSYFSDKVNILSGSHRGPGRVSDEDSNHAAALKDHELYDLLTLVDAIRIGAARDRELARDEIAKRLQ
jgi:hypothetical protein